MNMLLSELWIITPGSTLGRATGLQPYEISFLIAWDVLGGQARWFKGHTIILN